MYPPVPVAIADALKVAVVEKEAKINSTCPEITFSLTLLISTVFTPTEVEVNEHVEYPFSSVLVQDKFVTLDPDVTVNVG